MATHSSVLAWKIPWTKEPGSPWGRKGSDMTEHARTHCGYIAFSLSSGPSEDSKDLPLHHSVG